MNKDLKLGIVGGVGWLGTCIAEAIVKKHVVAPKNLGASFRSSKPAIWPGQLLTANNQELANWADVIIMSVRPADWPAVQVNAQGKLVISVMVGATLAQLGRHHQTERVIRTMPNVGAMVGHSYTPWVGSNSITAEDKAIVKAIFNACGVADQYDDESAIDYMTGLTGSGPAFPALFAEAMMKDAMARGFAADKAKRAVTELLIATGRLLEQDPKHPSETVAEFLNYKGTTAAAITAMRAAGLERVVSEGLAAALQKSVNMASKS